MQLDGSKELLEGFLPADGEHFDDFLDDSIQAISYQARARTTPNWTWCSSPTP